MRQSASAKEEGCKAARIFSCELTAGQVPSWELRIYILYIAARTRRCSAAIDKTGFIEFSDDMLLSCSFKNFNIRLLSLSLSLFIKVKYIKLSVTVNSD